MTRHFATQFPFRMIFTSILRGKLVYPFKKRAEWLNDYRFLRKNSYVQYVYRETLSSFSKPAALPMAFNCS
jgi:hypothetical protein